MSVQAAGTHKAVHVMRYDPQIASRFEQMELPVWGETEELRRFAAGYVKLLTSRLGADLDQRVIAYRLELIDGITGRVTDVLRRAATHAIATRSTRITLDTLQYVGSHSPIIINQRA